jgi:predicted nucleic acid-binding protein
MRLMLDLNVLLDVVQRREPFYEASASILSKVVEGALSHLEVVPQEKVQFVRARSLPMADFEDAVVASAAEAAECDVIISRNVTDFEGSPVQAMTPEEFLAYG